MLVKIWQLLFSIFYSHLEVEGIEHVPKDKKSPILFVSNHTNALVDPFMVMISLNRRVMLTARSTLVSFPFFGLLMKLVGVITFDRSQDRRPGLDRSHNFNSIKKCSDSN